MEKTMTVGELIDLLRDIPNSEPVVIRAEGLTRNVKLVKYIDIAHYVLISS